MNILHYTLGRSPFRSGGLTAWSEDLMAAQQKEGHAISLLFPGEITFRKKIVIQEEKSSDAVRTFKIVNPLPVPLIYGIDSAKHFMRYDRSPDFSAFFEGNNFDVIHLHTLMGLPIEFLQQAKNRGIRLVYTTHDTFGVWPEPDHGDRNNSLDPLFNLGYIGNQKALSYGAIVFMQSRLYKMLKSTLLLKRVKSFVRRIGARNGSELVILKKLMNQEMYQKLRAVYAGYFALIDVIHFNSALTDKIFRSYGIATPGFVAEVFHSHISKTGAISMQRSAPTKILFNGTKQLYKGYPLLLEVLDELYANGVSDFNLVVYGAASAERPYIEAHDAYSISQLSTVYAGIAVTVVPSLYYETFGMVVAESLSFGVPVIVSRTVGAQSLLTEEQYGSVFSTKEELKQQLLAVITGSRDEILSGTEQVSSAVSSFSAEKMYDSVLKSYETKEVS